MTQKIFTIMGATGHAGHVIVDDLLKRGHHVRALGRDEKKMKHLLNKGAEIWFLEYDDVDILTDSFKDAYAIFCMIPPAKESGYLAYQDRVSEAICQAIVNAEVSRVVNLSSVGAELSDGTGPIKGLHKHEQRLDALKQFASLVHLRPNFFMENLYPMIPLIQHQGVLTNSLEEDLPIPMVATRDIGWKAADFLDSSAPQPHLVFDFIGPKEVTMHHVTEVFAQAFDHPHLRYQQISDDDQRQLMLSVGFLPDMVELYIEMYKGFNTGLIKPTQELKLSHHGITTLEEFMQMLVHKTLVHA